MKIERFEDIEPLNFEPEQLHEERKVANPEP